MHTMRTMLLSAVLFAFAAGSAPAADPIGQVIAIEGKATLTGKDGIATPLAIRSPVMLGDRISTGPGAKLQIIFNDDSIIAQGEQSEMTIDEYVYAPSSKPANKCTLNFARGLFRAVTGKITDLNPERFKVRTRMATIGIRGCDIGFRLEQAREHVYVIDLPDSHRLFIETTALLAQGTLTAQQVVETLEVLEAGTVIRIETTGQTTDRVITLDEARSLILGTTPDHHTTGNNQPAGQTPGATGGALANTLPGTDSDTGADTTSDGDATSAGPSDGSATTPTTRDDLADDIAATESIETPTTTGTTTDTGSSGNETTRVNYQQQIAAGLDWSWGVWKDPNGVIYDLYVTGNFLDAASVQSIVSGSANYNLSGNGSAGALLNQNGARSYLQGNCAMQVNIGGGITPTWSGQYALQGIATDNSLVFNANGGIQNDGLLSGSAYYYNLNGTFYDPSGFQRNDVSGHLMGPGTTTPISGSAGTFNFVHGDGNTSIQGVYGVKLSPAL